jgi:hypothetical protein
MGVEAFLKGIAFPITADIRGLVEGLGQVDAKLTAQEQAFAKGTKVIQDWGVKGGIAATGLGIAIVGLTDDAKKVNAGFADTAITAGVTTDAMRELALSTSDAGFPLSEVANTFSLLTREGVRGDEQLQSIAKSFDTLGDATGNAADVTTSAMIPALNAFDIPLTEVGKHIDGLTYLTKNSTIDLLDFTSTTTALGPKLNAMGLSLEDTEAIMLALSKAGYQGTAATRLFRSAVSDAEGDTSKLYASLGLTEESVAGFKTEIDNATGSADKYAAAADSAIGTTDKAKNMFDEFKLSAGSLLEPLDGLGAVLSIGGPLLVGLTQLPALISGVNGAMIFLAANPIVLVIAAVALLVLGLYYLEVKFKWIETITAAFGSGWAALWDGMVWAVQGAANLISGVIDGMVNGIKWAVNIVIDGVNTLIGGYNYANSVGGLNPYAINVPSIPRLASGGIVTSPTIAMIGEAGPEAVIPLSGKGAGSMGVNITGNTFVVREEADIGKVAKQLYVLIEQGKLNRGIS